MEETTSVISPAQEKMRLYRRIKEKRCSWREGQKTSVAFLLSQIYLLLLSVGTVVSAQVLEPNGFTMLKVFMKEEMPLFLLSVLLVALAAELIYFLSFRPWLSACILYPVVTLLALVNGLKLQFRDEPLVLGDFSMIRETLGVAGDYGMKFRMTYPAVILSFLAFLYLAGWIKKQKINWKVRSVTAVVALFAVFFSFHFLVGQSKSLMNLKYKPTRWNQKMEYAKNGFILGFIYNAKSGMILPPEGYSAQAVRAAAERLGYTENPVTTALAEEEKPNVIVIMNESFWDPKFMTSMDFSIDPLQRIQDIGAGSNAGFGHVLSPQFGGGTSNVEYEFLTGMSMRFYHVTANLYQNNIREKTWSLAWYFKDLGYDTQAIHPYFNWFWRRQYNYPLMGFDQSFFREDMKRTELKGSFIGDSEVAREIMDKVPKDAERPSFTFAVTMQNHGAYTDERYEKFDVEVEGLDKDPKLKMSVENFTQGVYDGDKMFAELVEHYKDSERPTYIMMFGDHAPSFAKEETLYEDGKISEENRFSIQRCPLILWSSTGQTIEDMSTTSAFMLAPELLRAAGLPLTGYQDMQKRMSATTKGFTSAYILDALGESTEETEDIQSKIRDLQMLQYDATFGKHYTVDLFGTKQ